MKHYRYSSISDYHKCARYYELKHILGEKDDSDKSGDMRFGTGIHLAMQDILEGGNGHDAFNYYWNLTVQDSGLEWSRLNWQELGNMAAVFIDRFVKLHKRKYEPLFLEKQMKLDLTPTFGITGTADFIGKFEGVDSLLDFKTSAMPYSNLKIEHNEQMYGYSYMTRKTLGIDIKQLVYVVFVKNPKEPRIQTIIKPLTLEKELAMIENISDTCREIEGKSKFVRNPQACVQGSRTCPFFSRCFSEKATKS